MRYSVLRASSKRMLTQQEAQDYVSVAALLDKMESAGWLKPAVKRAKMRLYDVKDLDLCCDRLATGEFPE